MRLRMRRRMATARRTQHAALMPVCHSPVATTRPVSATTAEPSVTGAVARSTARPNARANGWVCEDSVCKGSVFCLVSTCFNRKWKSVLR